MKVIQAFKHKGDAGFQALQASANRGCLLLRVSAIRGGPCCAKNKGGTRRPSNQGSVPCASSHTACEPEKKPLPCLHNIYIPPPLTHTHTPGPADPAASCSSSNRCCLSSVRFCLSQASLRAMMRRRDHVSVSTGSSMSTLGRRCAAQSVGEVWSPGIHTSRQPGPFDAPDGHTQPSTRPKATRHHLSYLPT